MVSSCHTPWWLRIQEPVDQGEILGQTPGRGEDVTLVGCSAGAGGAEHVQVLNNGVLGEKNLSIHLYFSQCV